METLADRQIVETLLAQDRETAGALVTTDFIALRDRMTVGQAQVAIREAESLTRRFVRLFVVDAEDRLSGSVDFRQLLLASPERPPLPESWTRIRYQCLPERIKKNAHG